VFAREKVARWRSLTEDHFAFLPGSASEFLAEQNPETSWLTELLYENRFSALLQSAGGGRNLTTSFDMLLNYNLATSPQVCECANIPDDRLRTAVDRVDTSWYSYPTEGREAGIHAPGQPIRQNEVFRPPRPICSRR
jgi:hypothetical protein